MFNKLKKYLKLEKEEETEAPKELPENKLKGWKIYAPEVEMDEQNMKGFEAHLYDENYNPIPDKKFYYDIIGKTYNWKTKENGISTLPIGLRPRTYKIKVKLDSEDSYSPFVESKITIFENNDKKSNLNYTNTTKIYAPSMTFYANEEPDYVVRLTNKDDEPIKNEKVTIEIDGKTYSEITDENGFVSLSLNLEPGVYPIITRYKGNRNNESAIKQSKLTVNLRNIDRDVMIEIENLTMEFKISKDKIDTLKEYVIRSLKRNKSEKEKLKVLDDISFKIYKGERVGILGLNGAGKSTLLKILAGIYEPTSGTITTHGKIAPLLELGAGFDKNYTGENNIYLNGAFLSMTEEFINEKHDEIVEFSELGDYINFPVKNYSSGMRAKLGFSIATLVEPDILIVDEILSVGDIKFRKKSSEKLQSMMEDGVTVLLVSHSIEQIKNICDRCIWLENGKIIMEGDSDIVCEEYINSARAK